MRVHFALKGGDMARTGQELTEFVRGLFHAIFKTNSYMERAVLAA